MLNRPRPWSSLGEQFLWFSKNDLSWFNRIFLLFDARKSCVFQIFFLRSMIAYLCPNIINFDGVDFSGCRPEKVISFFWRSVYIYIWVYFGSILWVLYLSLASAFFINTVYNDSLCIDFATILHFKSYSIALFLHNFKTLHSFPFLIWFISAAIHGHLLFTFLWICK